MFSYSWRMQRNFTRRVLRSYKMLRSWRELSWKDYKNAGRRPVKVGEAGEEGKWSLDCLIVEMKIPHTSFLFQDVQE